MMNIYESKKQLRQKVLARAAKLEADYKKKSSRAITELLLTMEEFQKAKTVFCFVGRRNEVDTRDIIALCFEQGKTVAVPLVISKGVMEAKEIKSLDSLEIGINNILEPPASARTLDKFEIDFGIIPCVTCSHKGDRLGFGGGFYDRYMRDSDFTRACVCYEKLTEENIPMSRYDLKVDYLITEIGILSFKETSNGKS